jgi:DNA-binding SARP family transcriptional activator
VRLKRSDEALGELRKAAELDASQARYAYVYAVALHSAGREAMTALKENLARHPDDRDTLLALISFSRDSGDISSALEFAERLERVSPDEPGLPALIQELRRQAMKPSPLSRQSIAPVINRPACNRSYARVASGCS